MTEILVQYEDLGAEWVYVQVEVPLDYTTHDDWITA